MSKTTEHMIKKNHPSTWMKGEGRGLARRKGKPMSYDVNDIVRELLGCKDPMAHISGASDPEEDHNTLVNREYVLGLMDVHAGGEEFKFYHRRDIPLDLVDSEMDIAGKEEELDDLREFFTELRSYCKGNPNDNNAMAELADVLERGIRLKEELDQDKLELDYTYCPATVDSTDCPTEGAALLTYLEMYIDRMSLPELAVAMDAIETMRTSGTISWYYYIQAGLAVSFRLVRYCPTRYRMGRGYQWFKVGGGWEEVLTRLRKHNNTNHVKAVSYEDRFFGEMSFNMEEAIDLMNEVRHKAHLNHTDEYTQYLEVMARREERAGIMEGWAAPLPQHEVEAIMASTE